MKSILIIIPYQNIYPPMNGGMQRCFNILHQLVRHFKVTAIIHQDKTSFLKSTKEFPAIKEVGVFSTGNVKVKDVLSMLPSKWETALRSRWYQHEINSPADGSLIKYYPVLKQLLKKKHFDIIILENLATLNAVKIIRRYNKEVKIIYDAHNVDSTLAKAAYERKEITEKRYKSYIKTESNFHKTLDAVIACSENDKEILVKMNNGKLKIEVVPNGINIPEKKYNAAVNEGIPRFILFCGSLWSIPNAEGLHWVCKKIWPLILEQMPSLKLLVVGIGELPVKFIEIKDTPNMDLIGMVEDVKPWYNKSSVVIAPLLTGSGTRLKILEAMSMGVPVVSTSIGAEGIDYAKDKNILIADGEDSFARGVISLLANNEKREQLAQEAYCLAKSQYDWNRIGDGMTLFFKKLEL